MHQLKPKGSIEATRQRFGTVMLFALGFLVLCSTRAQAHGIDAHTREAMTEGSLLDYVWLGAEHMVTGYDHLLFLFGVIFFLTGFRDVVRFITAFTLGHCITLLGATLAGVSANAYLIDAVIALSVIYKGFENLDGFKKYLGIRAPNLLGMVFLFGLIHGFGLSTRLQELSLGEEGMVGRILAFNLGVELGQIAALTLMLGFFAAWRSTALFERFGKVANGALVLAGVGLFVFQIHGYLHEGEHHGEEPMGDHVDDHVDDHHDDPADDPVKTPSEEPAWLLDKPEDKPEDKKPHGHDHGHEHSHGDGKPHSH